MRRQEQRDAGELKRFIRNLLTLDSTESRKASEGKASVTAGGALPLGGRNVRHCGALCFQRVIRKIRTFLPAKASVPPALTDRLLAPPFFSLREAIQ